MSKDVKPYQPKAGVVIHVDLEDLAHKAVKYGPARVIGETLLSLCLLANDHFSRIKTNGTLPRSKTPENGKERAKT